MNKTLKGYVLGLLSASILTGGVALAKSGGEIIEAFYSNIKIYVDGVKIEPKDSSGNSVEPFIYNGTTYLPVRAVSEALGKEVYWDGSNYTVYIGSMKETSKKASALLSDMDNIGDVFWEVDSNKLTDNYGNSYSYAYMSRHSKGTFETLLNMKYKRFKAKIYVPQGCSSDKVAKVLIKTDGTIIYTSPDITKTSRPIDIDLNITGCNVFEIEVTDGRSEGSDLGYIADGEFYQ